MNSRRLLTGTRWSMALCALGGIVLVYKRWLHVNPTTVALTLLLLVLVLASEWGLRYAVAISIAATACYNFFFLPPLNTFTIADTQNWLALLAFLTTSIIASRLSQRVRNEADDARARQRELDTLFRLSRELLQPESVSTLLTTLPATVAGITDARSAYLFLLDGNRLYQTGGASVAPVELPHLEKLANSLAGPQRDGDDLQLPIRSGVRPRGLFVMQSPQLSNETANAIAGLISLALDRAQALENLARGEAGKESERLRTLMIDSITHELRTPLTSIKGAVTTLLSSQISREDTQDLLSIIDEESDRLNHLVSEAVEMAQLDTQQVQMHMKSVRLAAIVEDVLESSAWVQAQHPLQVDIPEAAAVTVDPAFFEKALSNLIDNAAKYSSAGSPIVITATSDRNGVTISVADRGAGIDASEQSLIFERFYRGKSNSEIASGTGMGLAITRSIVQAHGGEIAVVSQPGKGSVFSISLPAARA